MSTPTKSSSNTFHSPGQASPSQHFSLIPLSPRSPNLGQAAAAASSAKNAARFVFGKSVQQENSLTNLRTSSSSTTHMSGMNFKFKDLDSYVHRPKNIAHPAHTIPSTPQTGEGRTFILYFDVEGFQTEPDQRQTRQTRCPSNRFTMRHMRLLSDTFSSGASSRKKSRAVNMNQLVGSPSKKMRTDTTNNPNAVLSPMLKEASISRHSSKQSRPATKGLLSSGSPCASSSSSSTQMSVAKIIKVKVRATFKHITRLGQGANKSVDRVEVISWEYPQDNLTQQSIEKLNSIRDNIQKYVLATEKKSVRYQKQQNPRKRMTSILDEDRKIRRQAKKIFGDNIIDVAVNSPSPRKQMSAELKPLRTPLPTPFILPASKSDLNNPQSQITQSVWAEICNLLALLIATPHSKLNNTADLKPANCGLDDEDHIHVFDAGLCSFENDDYGLAATLIQWVGDNTVTIGDEDKITIEWALAEIINTAISMSETTTSMSKEDIRARINGIINYLIDWKKEKKDL
ncbi:hypothetical protein N9N03_02525 [Chlamydiia bacterium]|nr:hypothetical protein [Chlamydiia bacterium]